MRTRLALLVSAGLCALPAAASASTVSSDGGAVTFRSGADASNVTVTDAPYPFQLAFVDTGSVLRAGLGCDAGPPVTCPGSGFDMYLGRGDDVSFYSGFGTARTHGGDGDDTMVANGQTAKVHGGAGDDAASVNANGSASAYGNDGDDSLVGRGSATTLAGGDGDDVAAGGGQVDNILSGNGGFDTLVAYVGRHSAGATVTGGDGYDLLATRSDGTARPGDGSSTLDGGTGDDTILGGPGQDTVTGGGGNDAIDVSGDGVADTVDCGGGYDIVWSDPEDVVARNCEGRRTGPMPHTGDVDEKLADAARLWTDGI
jgi:Ca2+-binding RTX toxin-like protein